MKKKLFILAPLLAGILCAAARYTLVTTSVNAETGIPFSDVPIAVFFGVVLAVALVFLYLSRFKFKTAEIVDAQKNTPIYKACSVVAGILLLASGVLSLMELATGGTSILVLVMAIFAMICGGCIVAGVKMRNNTEVAAFCSVIPVFYSALKLLMFYRGNNSNPMIYSYSMELFAFFFSMFSFYCVAAAFFGKNNPQRVVFFSMTSVFIITAVLLSDTLLPMFTKGHLHFAFSDIAVLAAFLFCNISNLVTIKNNPTEALAK